MLHSAQSDAVNPSDLTPMAPKVTVRGETYAYDRSQETSQSHGLLRVAVAPSPDRQVIGWATTVGTSSVVVVSVDGKVVARGPGGSFDYGFPLAPDATHLVVVRVLRPEAAKKMGLVIYGPDRF